MKTKKKPQRLQNYGYVRASKVYPVRGGMHERRRSLVSEIDTVGILLSVVEFQKLQQFTVRNGSVLITANRNTGCVTVNRPI